MTQPPMTEHQFEEWWEGLGDIRRLLAVEDCFMDDSVLFKHVSNLTEYANGWPLAGFLLDYARTHEPPTWKAAGCAACVGINPQVDCPRKAELHGVQDNEDGLRYWALIWGVEAEGPTGPAAVQKAFVKAHKVRR